MTLHRGAPCGARARPPHTNLAGAERKGAKDRQRQSAASTFCFPRLDYLPVAMHGSTQSGQGHVVDVRALAMSH